MATDAGWRELGNKSRKLGNKSRKLGNKSRELGNKSRELGTKYRELGNKSWELGNKSWELGNKSRKLGSNGQSKSSGILQPVRPPPIKIVSINSINWTLEQEQLKIFNIEIPIALKLNRNVDHFWGFEKSLSSCLKSLVSAFADSWEHSLGRCSDDFSPQCDTAGYWGAAEGRVHLVEGSSVVREAPNAWEVLHMFRFCCCWIF